MNKESINHVIGGIDEDLIEQADVKPERKHIENVWFKWSAVVAFAAVLVMGVFLSGIINREVPEVDIEKHPETIPETQPETMFSERYVYSVDEGVYATYEGGRVIDVSQIGAKLETVAVTGGWMNSVGTMLTEEHVNAEVYEIEEISTDIAVAIRFLGKLDAMTTEHYYVIVNPEADLTSVWEYVINYYPANGEE